MIILDRLHRGDIPRMVPVTAVQSDGRLLFTDMAAANAFIEAYRRADSTASFIPHDVPGISLRDFWQQCRDHDWHYENSDDQRAWREGGSSASMLAVQALISHSHSRIHREWQRHHFSGPAYGTEKRPAPEEPAA